MQTETIRLPKILLWLTQHERSTTILTTIATHHLASAFNAASGLSSSMAEIIQIHGKNKPCLKHLSVFRDEAERKNLPDPKIKKTGYPFFPKAH